MGGAESKKGEIQVFKVEEWQAVEWEPYTNIKDPTYSSNFSVYAHKNNPNLEIQKYQFYFNSQAEYISYLQIFYERKKYPQLVNSVYIEQISKKSMCSTFLSANVYLQRIHFRLFQLIQVPIEEGLYIIESALEGYQNMFPKTGYFDVASDMIGINKQGKAKVWFNKNFAKNFPQFNKIDHNKGQADFIKNLIKVVQESMDYIKGQEKFSEFILKKNVILTFNSAKALVRSYISAHKLCPQRIMKSIVLWVKKTNRKIQYSNNQYFTQLKSSTYSVKSNGTKKNQQSQKTMGNIYSKDNRKIQFNKLKIRKSNLNGKIQMDKSNLNILNKNDLNLAIQDRQKSSDVQKYILPYNNNAVSHLSFAKNQRRVLQIEDAITQQNTKFPIKTSSKLPSVSFSYKSGGIFSPQNMEARQNEWFGKTTSGEVSVELKKDSRRSLILSRPNQLQQKMQFYYTSGDTQEIDPDIARDLYTMGNSYE